MRTKLAIAALLVLAVVVVATGCSDEPVDPAEREAMQLAKDYKAELNVDLEIGKLEVVSGDGNKDERSLVIAYVTKAGQDRDKFNEEVLSLVQPAANEKYGLVDITILATDDEGTISKTVSIDVEDVREWTAEGIEHDEFVQRWIVTGW